MTRHRNSRQRLFNGVNLPTIYALTEVGELVLKKRFTYAEFAERWGDLLH